MADDSSDCCSRSRSRSRSSWSTASSSPPSSPSCACAGRDWKELAGEGKEAAKDAILVRRRRDRIPRGHADRHHRGQPGRRLVRRGLLRPACSSCSFPEATFRPPWSTSRRPCSRSCSSPRCTSSLGELVPSISPSGEPSISCSSWRARCRSFTSCCGRCTGSSRRSSTWTLRRLGHGEVPRTPLTEEELKLVLTDSHEEGVLTEGEARIMLRAFEFADKDAEEILIAPEHVDFISLSRTFEENLAVLRRHMHARLPSAAPGSTRWSASSA